MVLLFSLVAVASGQIKLRRIDGWRKITAVLSQHTGVAFMEAMSENGYVDGRDFVFDLRYVGTRGDETSLGIPHRSRAAWSGWSR